MVKSVPSRNAPMSPPPRPQPSSPLRHSSAWPAANSSGVWPALLACASSIHGRNSAGDRSGKVRQRSAASPDTRSCVAASTAPPRKRSAMGPDSRWPAPVLRRRCAPPEKLLEGRRAHDLESALELRPRRRARNRRSATTERKSGISGGSERQLGNRRVEGHYTYL